MFLERCQSNYFAWSIYSPVHWVIQIQRYRDPPRYVDGEGRRQSNVAVWSAYQSAVHNSTVVGMVTSHPTAKVHNRDGHPEVCCYIEGALPLRRSPAAATIGAAYRDTSRGVRRLRIEVR